MPDTLIEDCSREAIALLRRNCIPAGIMAATRTPAAENRRYTRIFARDAGICALAMIHTDDEILQAAAYASLVTLARHQAGNGQIPKYVDPDREDSDFWYVGCIDASLWWLIAVHHVDREHLHLGLRDTVQPQIERALLWLGCQEHPRLFLLRQDEASDWADIMPRSGFVLYSNALWYYVKTLYGVAHQGETRYHFNHLFHPFTAHTPEYRRLRLLRRYVRSRSANRDLYLSFVNFSFWGEEGDVFGNLLALLCGLADSERTRQVMDALEAARIDEPWPVRATCEPIARDSSLWRAYMERHQQNLEFQYHNGGCWPFIGGFWVMVLSMLGRQGEAQQALERLAQANAVGQWSFREWFHGRSGDAHGMTGQSWNAAMFLLARTAVKQPVAWHPGGF